MVSDTFFYIDSKISYVSELPDYNLLLAIRDWIAGPAGGTPLAESRI
jgi:hypothetical protein